MKKKEIYNIVKKHLLKYGADEIAEMIDIDEENLLRVVNKIAKNISDEISEQHVNIGSIGNIYDNRTEFTATIQENHNDRKSLHISDVVSSDSKEQFCIDCFNYPTNSGGKFNHNLCDKCYVMSNGNLSNFKHK